MTPESELDKTWKQAIEAAANKVNEKIVARYLDRLDISAAILFLKRPATVSISQPNQKENK
jgi:hypothetical protein